MNYGLPIIAMDEGGSKELVLHDTTGFMLKPDDTGGLVETMCKLSTDAALRIRMSQAAYERSKHFNLEYRVDEFIAMYKKILTR
jgi:glycosyltransferase involved in cell wall biosynthesis